ncbi:MAG: pre-peptidase C-terminal domain-containing protein [Planctomycetaceae bacterium]|nr:pre-peptidase C-terminal domain-containing protein [Planctomycetaceae bacterium]
MPIRNFIALPSRGFFPIILLGIVLGDVSVFAEPQITGLSPRSVKPGGEIDVTLTGKDLAGATQLWTSFPADVSLAPGIKDNGKQADKVVFRVKPTNPQALGVHGVRVVTATGVSPLALVVVDDLPTVAQQASNKSPETAQALTLPTAVDGRVDNLSLNYYRFSAEAGQRISMEVLARRMGSALDPMIRLFKADGTELAYSDDAPGLLGDARLCHTFEDSGEYILEIRDIRFQGGANHVYHLRVGEFPCINVPYPLGVQRGKKVTLEFAGPDTEGIEPVKLDVPKNPELKWLTVGTNRTGETGSGFATVSVGDAEEILETEPINTLEQSQKVSLSANFNGRLQEANDVDRFTFPAKKGTKFTFTAVTRSQGSPADLVLRLFDAKGKKIAEADDTGTEDAVLNATFPADGDFTLAIEDLHGRGGSAFAYRIAVTETQPGFTLETTSDKLNVPQGGVAMLEVVARRSGYTGPITIKAENLPEGVTVCTTVIGAGQTGVNLCLQSTDAAKPGDFKDLKIVGEGIIGGKTVTAVADASLALKAQTNQMPYPPANLTDALALGVGPATPFSLRTEPAEITFGRDLSAKFKVIATRQKDYNEPITIAVPTVNNGGAKPIPGLPGNVTAALKPIPKDQNEIEITLTANNKAAEGDFTIVFDGSLKKGKATIKQPAASLTIKLQKPFSLSLEPNTIALKPEGKQKIKITVERNPALSAPVDVTFKNLPAGVTAPKTTIPADQSSVEIELTATKDAKPASANNVTAEGQAALDKAKFAGASGAVTVTVEK